MTATIYFIRNPKTKLTKIGATEDLPSRLIALISTEKQNLVIDHFIVVDSRVLFQLEHRLHRHFSEWCHHGEWFVLPDDWLQEIDYALAFHRDVVAEYIKKDERRREQNPTSAERRAAIRKVLDRLRQEREQRKK